MAKRHSTGPWDSIPVLDFPPGDFFFYSFCQVSETLHNSVQDIIAGEDDLHDF